MHLKSAELGINSTAVKAFPELKKMIYWCSHFVILFQTQYRTQ